VANTDPAPAVDKGREPAKAARPIAEGLTEEQKAKAADAIKALEKQKAAATDAIKSLGKIKAAVEVGVNLRQYSQLVIDAKAAVNEAEGTLPAGEMLITLKSAIDAYRDALTVWNHKYLGVTKVADPELFSRYKLETDKSAPGSGADTILALKIIWRVAATKLAKARSLSLGGESAPQPVDSPFVGRWKLVNEKGDVWSFYVTVTSSFGAKRDHDPAPGRWEIVGKEARITWDDGYRDIMRLGDGKITYLGLGKAQSWDAEPTFQLQAVRIPIAEKK
jgi:hypothetical protein